MLAAVMLEVYAIMHRHLVTQDWSFHWICPDVIGYVPDQQVGILEIFLGPFLECVEHLEHTVMIAGVIGGVIVVADCCAQADFLMVADLAVD